MAKRTQQYGHCMGVPGYVSPHIFYDGRTHHPSSHGMCPECRRLAMKLFLRELETQSLTAQTSPAINMTS
ncbi:hypothetical protein GF324_11025 [bacterium]|nr:hypothetical protein [bacterium]